MKITKFDCLRNFSIGCRVIPHISVLHQVRIIHEVWILLLVSVTMVEHEI
jgi:hypothetical protein